jgi:hypothetical protein
VTLAHQFGTFGIGISRSEKKLSDFGDPSGFYHFSDLQYSASKCFELACKVLPLLLARLGENLCMETGVGLGRLYVYFTFSAPYPLGIHRNNFNF